MLNYYNFDKPTLENKNFYLDNEGIFNLWNDYLLVHINGYNLVLVNKLGREFSGSITSSEETSIKNRFKNEFCNVKGCSTTRGATSCCEIIKDWGEDVCNDIWEWLNT